MQRLNQLLLSIWQEACRHIEMSEFIGIVADLLGHHLPLQEIIVRRIDREQGTISTVAVRANPQSQHVAEDRRQYQPSELKQVLRWGKNGRLLFRGKRPAELLTLIVPEGISEDVLAIPLVHDSAIAGALLLVAPEGREFRDSHRELLEKLREPFSVALENDRRLHEMASLREAAEADRGSLLRRLGRKELVEEIVGEQSGLRLVMERINLVTSSDVPVLILGETGTGKEVVARAIHVRSERHDGPFIRVNCGAIPPELIDSQLFGHERGSFTGAEQSRQGWFERADQGTLLLDEIGELPLEAQVRLLRVLQDGFIERVGGVQPVHVDVRIVAATHRDLAQMVRESRFREDLWYRLAVFPILMPPLRDRKDDIPDLARHFAERAAIRFGLPSTKATSSDLSLLQSYDWPGNIREFGAVIDRAVILGNGQSLEIGKSLGFVDAQTRPGAHAERKDAPNSRYDERAANAPLMTLDEAMKAHIERALVLCAGKVEGRGGAAAILDINPHTLRARMRKLGVRWSEYRN